jgi:hypothetical protein
MSADPELLATPQGRQWYDQIKSGHGAEAALAVHNSYRTLTRSGEQSH